MTASDSAAAAAAPAASVLNVAGVRFAYGRRTVLDGIDLAIAGGEIVALLGPNGAGKSTLIRCVCGRLAPDAGRVRVSDGDPRTDATARAHLGLVPQQVALFPHLTVAENIRTFARLAGVARSGLDAAAASALERCALDEVADQRAGTLSGGWQRRVNIACAIAHGPTLLILDEPTVGIDPPACEQIERLLAGLADSGMAVLMTSHDLAQLQRLASRLAFLGDGGILADGAPDQLLRSRFGARRECTVRLNGSAPASLDPSSFGLEPASSEPGVWTGRVEPETAARLTGQVRDASEVLEFRLRRPGLDVLWREFYGAPPEPVTAGDAS